ncbi:T9SS type A sorting domain-containing protein [Hymenobacter cellulosilyticus]|uniref:T9SS type A sorting domain-containing protein n=1 Tax=Hymenobacter cellulosilyticus TaxID=2932248 RepID=A0A8T9Q824_9BACT|nr:T9SS type A sorting domain-containing protein [Hymenobacter cellulosilyticus]UOQ71930.1 T9SS type A sorting domain-containing protein [Hymenobacter cellulosilyticus]
MKKTFVRLFLTALTTAVTLTAASAQALSNGTLENWETRGPYQAPTDWFTTDDVAQAVIPGLPFAVNATTRTTDAHGGTYAARLANTNNVLLGMLPGILGIGGTVNPASNTIGGISFTGRPARVEFFYKLTGANAAADMPAAQVVLTKTVNGQQSLVASGELLITPANGYTLASVPLEYESSIAPDTIQIIFSSSTADEPMAGTVLFVDDVTVAGTALATVNAARNAAITVSPNPSNTGLFTLSTARDASWTRSAYTVTDVAGRVVYRGAAAPVNATGQRTVDLRGQKAGLYTLRLDTPEGPVVHKLLLQ